MFHEETQPSAEDIGAVLVMPPSGAAGAYVFRGSDKADTATSNRITWPIGCVRKTGSG